MSPPPTAKKSRDVPSTTGTLYRYDGQMGIEDVEYATNPQGTTISTLTRYGLGARGIDVVSRTTSSGNTVSYPLYDAHGNNVGALSKNGSSFVVSDEKSYDAWGGLRSGTNANGKAAYSANLGHKQDDESGLIYMRARYYEPTSGRFVSQDPQRAGANDFIFCSNDPVNLVDKSGLEDTSERDGLLLAGNLLVIIGFFLLNNGKSFNQLDLDWLQKKIIDKAVALGGSAATGIDKSYFKLALKMIRAAKDYNKNIAAEGEEHGLKMKAGMALIGYSLMLKGQCDLTDAEFLGGGDWWGWDIVGSAVFP